MTLLLLFSTFRWWKFKETKRNERKGKERKGEGCVGFSPQPLKVLSILIFVGVRVCVCVRVGGPLPLPLPLPRSAFLVFHVCPDLEYICNSYMRCQLMCACACVSGFVCRHFAFAADFAQLFRFPTTAPPPFAIQFAFAFGQNPIDGRFLRQLYLLS